MSALHCTCVEPTATMQACIGNQTPMGCRETTASALKKWLPLRVVDLHQSSSCRVQVLVQRCQVGA